MFRNIALSVVIVGAVAAALIFGALYFGAGSVSHIFEKRCSDQIGEFVFKGYTLAVPVKYTMFINGHREMLKKPLGTKSMPLKALLPDMKAKCDVYSNTGWLANKPHDVNILLEQNSDFPKTQAAQIHTAVTYYTSHMGAPRTGQHGDLKLLQFLNKGTRMDLYISEGDDKWSVICERMWGMPDRRCIGHVYGYTGLNVQYDFSQADIDNWRKIRTAMETFIKTHMRENGEAG